MSHRPTTHWTELPEDTTGGTLSREWSTYRRLVGQLLADGHENRWVLIVGEELIGMWDTYHAARAVSIERYFMQPVLVKQLLAEEPLLRGPQVWKWDPVRRSLIARMKAELLG